MRISYVVVILVLLSMFTFGSCLSSFYGGYDSTDTGLFQPDQILEGWQ